MQVTALRAYPLVWPAVNFLNSSLPLSYQLLIPITALRACPIAYRPIANIRCFSTPARTNQPTHDNPQRALQHHGLWLADLCVDLFPRNERQRISGSRRRWRTTCPHRGQLHPESSLAILRRMTHSIPSLVRPLSRSLTLRVRAILLAATHSWVRIHQLAAVPTSPAPSPLPSVSRYRHTARMRRRAFQSTKSRVHPADWYTKPRSSFDDLLAVMDLENVILWYMLRPRSALVIANSYLSRRTKRIPLPKPGT